MERPSINNPVLRGFFPDPSFVRAGDDYYIASSTFEWFPGVALHHSRDLVNWRLVGHALTRRSQLDLVGIGDSAGVWAPSLSYADGRFWLVTTCVRTAGAGRPFKDTPVFLSTATDILGPWSEPLHLNSIGFDPSLFHDLDGSKWLLNMRWDFRKTGLARFAGIVAQEYDPVQQVLVGPVTTLVHKTVLCEGPNLYQHNGWYYLLMAEGGTGWNHGVSMARSRHVTGPYELDPEEAVLTTRHTPDWPLQKAGHGELVQTSAGEWWLAHLCSRPVGSRRRCILGRETALQRVVWSEDGWLRLAHGGVLPALTVPAPEGLPPHPWSLPPNRDDFDGLSLGPDWSTLRTPADPSWLSLSERPGWLRLRGRESMSSFHEQSVVARRLQTFRAVAETRMEFKPTHFMQLAGLVCWYDTRTYYYLRVTHDEARGTILGVVQSNDGVYEEIDDGQIAINEWPTVYLRVEIDHERLRFFASADGEAWRAVGAELDATRLSDDYGTGLHFTGTLVGLAAHDMLGTRVVADFDYFELRNA